MTWPKFLQIGESVAKLASTSGLMAQYALVDKSLVTVCCKYDNDVNELEVFQATNTALEGTKPVIATEEQYANQNN